MQESIVHEGYVRDMIHNYGLDIRYYKYAYGEGYVQEWEDPVRMVAYIKWDSDSIILNAWGAVPDSTMTMWLDQTDFSIALAKKLA